ncbi:flagellin lysine-N-methylase [Cohnella sp. WQ 127256]|uniref:flagellin lysine-N-methylase n=1 Tax=Cohnella sp. WQ 127256 TaxID=2938790 RepID=UPI002119034C|nr:flagellin lysine-N-methylase [Cohnella sp. WQ 127256]
MENKAIVPSYMEKFTCIGSKCEDTCCGKWKIFVEKDIYEQFSQLSDEPVANKFINSINPLNIDIQSYWYGTIRMLDDGLCPMLTETKLCSIQAELGEDYLPTICTTFPRTLNEVNGKHELSFDLGCPEAARIALLNENGIQFVEAEVDTKLFLGGKIDNITNETETLSTYFWPIRVFTIQTLQNRDYSFEDRLILLGLFSYELNSIVNQGKLNRIPKLIEDITHSIVNGEFKEYLTVIPIQWTSKLVLFNEFVKDKIEYGIGNQNYHECFINSLEGLNYTNNADPENVIKMMREANDQYLGAYLDEHEYIMENYAVSYVFNKLFPLTRCVSVAEEYQVLLLHCFFIQTHLSGLGSFTGGLTNEIAIRLIYSYTKNNERDEPFTTRILSKLKESGLDQMEQLATIIKR